MPVSTRACFFTIAPVLLGLVLFSAHDSAAQTQNANLTVSGNSTIRSWSCKAPGTVQIKPSASAPAIQGLSGGVETGTLTVKVVDLACTNEEMTGHLREAMQPDRNPTITFQLAKYAVAGSSAEAQGTLTINGISKPVTLPLKLQSAEGGGVRLEGETSINMTDYKVEPPTVLLGALTVRPVVRVRFDATLR